MYYYIQKEVDRLSSSLLSHPYRGTEEVLEQYRICKSFVLSEELKNQAKRLELWEISQKLLMGTVLPEPVNIYSPQIVFTELSGSSKYVVKFYSVESRVNLKHEHLYHVDLSIFINDDNCYKQGIFYTFDDYGTLIEIMTTRNERIMWFEKNYAKILLALNNLKAN